jgi:hypothetical protein
MVMWWPTCNYNTCTRNRRASFLIRLMMGAWRLKHVEWLCRNKTCTVLHQVGVLFDLYYDARKHKSKIWQILVKRRKVWFVLNFWLIFFPVALRPNAGHGLLIIEVSRSHKTTHHIRWDSSGRVISSSHRTLPDNTQRLQQTSIHASGGIRNHDLSRRAAVDLRLRSRGHLDRR